MEFARGDGANHEFLIPTDAWSAGGRLFFAAKQAVDDDDTDALALIQGSWTDSAVTDDVDEGVAMKKYACHFPASATNDIDSGGADEMDLLGEFQFVPATGDPITFPPNTPKIPVKLYFDVKRKIIP